MQVHDVELTISAVEENQYPATALPELALVGRSNVGKSSLTNVLINRKNYAHTSSQPGKTQTLNFYEVEHKLYFVDVPGYGYAKVSKSMKETWQDLASAYLRGRPTLVRVCLLIDTRHGVKESDRETMRNLDKAAVSYQIVLTKADKLKKGEGEAVQAATLKAVSKRPAAFPVVALTSSEKGLGLPELRAEIMRTTGVVLD